MVADQGVRLGWQQQYHAVQQRRFPRPGAIVIGDGSWLDARPHLCPLVSEFPSNLVCE